MPQRDKTGPEGKGPLTGRGFGRCNPKNWVRIRIPRNILGFQNRNRRGNRGRRVIGE